MLLDLTPPTGFGLAHYPPGATFGPRRMGDYELVWLVEGDATYLRTEPGERERAFEAKEGSMVLCRPGAVDAFRWDPQRRTRHAFVHFDVRSVPKDWPPLRDWPTVVAPVDGDLLVPLFQHLLTWASRRDQTMLVQTVSLMLRLFVTGQRAMTELPADVAPDPVERAIAHLHRTLESDPAAAIALDDLAEAACVTPEHLCRVFKKTLDLSPMECVRLARLDRAAVLLTRSNCSVGQIAEMCGFASQFHFARRFKEAFGDTPTRIRLRVRQGANAPLPRLLRNAKF